MSPVPKVQQSQPAARPWYRASSWVPGGFMRGEASPVFSSWAPPMRDPAEDVRAAYSRAAGRATNLIQNSGWLTGAIEQATADVVGGGLRLRLLPDAKALGWTEEFATDWAAGVEDRFNLWSDNPRECDIEERRTFGQMQAAQYGAWFGPGEIVSENAWKTRPGCTYGTKVRLIPAHRLSQRSTLPRLVQGVQMDEDWAPISYWFWRRMSFTGAEQEVEMPARDKDGAQRIVHIFDGKPGTYRGISPLVSAIETCRRFDQLTGATLTSELIRAVFAVTITSDEPTEDVIKGFLTAKEQAAMESAGLSSFDVYGTMNEEWYRNKPTINLGEAGRFAHLFPGQKMEMHASDKSTSEFKDLAMMLLREILRCLGLTFESGTGDYSGATYSSVRMATSSIYSVTLLRRKNIIAPFCRAHFEAWLEEEIARGLTKFPGGLAAFRAKRAAASRSAWVGTPMAQADPLKTQKTHEGYKNMGVMTDDDICSQLGTDVHDVYKQRQREMKLRQKYGLPETATMAPDPVADKLLTSKEQ